MSVKTSKTQADHLLGATKPTIAATTANHVPRRTTYHVKIPNSEELNSKFCRWIGGHNMSVVRISEKQFSELAAAKSRDSLPEPISSLPGENVCGSVAGSSMFHPALCPYASTTNCTFSAASIEPTTRPPYDTVSVAMVSHSELLPTSCVSTGSYSKVSATCKPVQSRVLGTNQSLALSCCQPGISATGVSSERHYKNGSLNSSLKPWSNCNSIILQGLQHRVKYLGTVAVSSRNAVANSAGDSSASAVQSHFDHSDSDAYVISAFKKFTDHRNKQLNGQLLNGSQFTCSGVNRDIETTWKNHNQPVSQSQTPCRYLKRPYFDGGDQSCIVSAKKFARSVTHSFDCAKGSKFAGATNSEMQIQSLTLNHVAKSDEHSNQCSNDENKCYSQPKLSIRLVPRIGLSSHSGMLLLLYCL